MDEKKFLIILVVLANLFMCSSPKSMLSNSGELYIMNITTNTEIPCKKNIIIKWRNNNREFYTAALVSGYEQIITATVIEANSSYIRLESSYWDNVENLPAEYLEAANNIVINSSKAFSIYVPTDSVAAIYKYGEKSNYAQNSVEGAQKGGQDSFSDAVDEADEKIEKREINEDENVNAEIASETVLGTILGAIFYPIAKHYEDPNHVVGEYELNTDCEKIIVNRLETVNKIIIR